MSRRVLICVLAGALAAAGAAPTTGSARAAVACGARAYSYAGVEGARTARGVAATLAPLDSPHVGAGHVAAWVGLGSPGGGPNGADEWIQVGLTAEHEWAYDRLYVEIVKPGEPPAYVELSDVPVGQSRRVAVREVYPNWWNVFVGGAPALMPVYLPESHRAWRPTATAESWNGGVGACNSLAYRFADVRYAAGRRWQSLRRDYAFHDPGYRLVGRGRSAFLAVSRDFPLLPAPTLFHG